MATEPQTTTLLKPASSLETEALKARIRELEAKVKNQDNPRQMLSEKEGSYIVLRDFKMMNGAHLMSFQSRQVIAEPYLIAKIKGEFPLDELPIRSLHPLDIVV